MGIFIYGKYNLQYHSGAPATLVQKGAPPASPWIPCYVFRVHHHSPDHIPNIHIVIVHIQCLYIYIYKFSVCIYIYSVYKYIYIYIYIYIVYL